MAIPPQLLLAAARMLKNRKSPTAQIKEALAPATDALKNDIAPLVGMGADAGMMYNLRAEDPSMRTGIATGAIGSAARGFQANGIKGLITGGIMGGLTGAIATGNAKEQKAEQDKYTYLNQMYSSVVGADTDLQSALMYAEDGGEIVSAEGETFVPIQTEAKKIGKKLVKEKFIFSDGKIADVNATKPHSEQKKDAVTDITVEGTYVMPVSTKLSKKDLDSLISYSTSNYSENGKNFAVEKVTLRDILGEKFEGSFAEATDIITKKYPVMDTDDDLDPIARITNNENIANRSKIVAHLMRLNEAKINKEPIEEVKLAPSMNAKTGGYVKKYVLGSTVNGDPTKPTKPKTALEKRKEKYDANKPKPVNPYTLRAYEPDSKAKKIYKTLVAPVSAMDNRPGTSYDDPSGLDVALGVLNPFAWIDGAATVLKSTKNIVTGEGQDKDYATVGVSAAGAALGLRGSKAKGVGDKISKFMNNMYNPVPSNIIGKKQVVDISDFNKENEYYRVVVGDDAFNDIVQTGTVRTKTPVDKVTNKEGFINLDRRGTTPYPSFSKGKASIEYAKDNPNNYIVVTADESIKPSTSGRHGVGTTMFPTSSEGKHLKELAADKVKVYKHMGDGKYELVDHMPTTPKMTKGSFISQYVLKPKMSLKKGGYIRKMAAGGGVSDPPGKKYTNKAGNTIIVGNDKKFYWKNKDGSFKEADQRIVDSFNQEIKSSNNPTGPANSWRLLGDSTPKTNNGKNGDYKVLEEYNREYQQRWYQGALNRGLKDGTYTQEDADRLLKNAQDKGYILEDPKPLDNRKLDPINSMETMDILGTPIVRYKTQVNTESPTINTKRGGDYLVQKANQELTPTDMWYPNTYTSEGSVKSDGATKYTPKGGYYIPGENKNRYDKDSEGNWYVQKNDGKTWVPASSLPNSADVIKKLNDESKPWNVSTPSKPASSSSLVKPKAKTASNAAPITKKEIENINENNSEIKNSYYRAYSDNAMRKNLLNNFKETSDDDINNTINFINLAGDTAGDGSPELSAYYAKKIREEKAKRSSYNLKVTSKRKGGYVIPTKMAKGGYIKKMAGGGPIVPIIPERWRDIWAIDETGQQPYYPMPNMVNNPLYDMSPIGKISNALPSDNNPYQVGVPIGTPRLDDNPYEIGKQIGTPRAGSTTSTPNTGDTDVLDMYRNKISERKGDAVRDAEEAKTEYNALKRRVGMRDLTQLVTGLAGTMLQNRTEKRAFRRPPIAGAYPKYSAQQINAAAEADTGAMTEAVKAGMNTGGDGRMSRALAPVLMARLTGSAGKTRAGYNEINRATDVAKYKAIESMQQFNSDEEIRAQRVEQDNNNKTISNSTNLIGKYISSQSSGDIEGYKAMKGIGESLTDKLYKLDNNELQADMIGKEYEMYMSDVRQKITDLEAQLLDPKISFDEAARKSVEYYIAKNKEELRLLEERDKKNKIRQNINGN